MAMPPKYARWMSIDSLAVVSTPASPPGATYFSSTGRNRSECFTSAMLCAVKLGICSGRKPEVPPPAFRQRAAVPPADVAEQPVVVGPFGDRRCGDRLLPRPVARDPPPGVDRRLGGRQRLGAVELLLRHADFLRLAHDEIDVAFVGMLVFDELFVFVREDFLLDVELGRSEERRV